ncbi:MAG: hypothetical protein P4M07_19980 [Xanthobacteraceae bacterium]|nr:hypothetical protein [Xanthobacteraceae bacterium]
MPHIRRASSRLFGNVGRYLGTARLAPICGLLFLAAPAAAQQPQLSAHDLAKLVQNPLADSISIPFANDTNFPYGPYRQTGNILNVQPVIPFRLNDDWNIITRTTLPFMSQVRMSPDDPPSFGMGDIVPMIALSPSRPGNVIWGAGPTFSLPTATAPNLGTGQWAAGPSAVVVVQPDPWVFGLLVSQWWSFAGPRAAAPMNRTAAQLFVVYNFSDGWFLSYSPIITADWSADSRDRWTVPVGGEVGRVFEVGGQAMSAAAGLYYNAVRPGIGPEWQARLNLTLIFPH